MLVPHAAAHGIDIIRLVAPTTDDEAPAAGARRQFRLRLLRQHHRHHRHPQHHGRTSRRGNPAHPQSVTDLPIAVGFGVRSPAQAAEAVARSPTRRWWDRRCDTLDRQPEPAASRISVQQYARSGARPCRPACAARGCTHELAHRIRPPEDPHAVRPARGAREPLAPMPGLPADDLPSRPAGEPEGLPALLATTCASAPSNASATRSTKAASPASSCRRSSADPLRFRDTKRYTDRLKEARDKTHLDDALVVAHGRIDGHQAVVAAMEFEFIGGSMGAAVGDGIVAAARLAVLQDAPLIVFTASGGARMQEGAISLMQMPRTVIATRLVKEAGLPYIVVLTDPTTGGVTASFPMLGDIHIAEPGALIGFAGPRVIEQTVREKLPEGFQRAEYLHEHGIVDMVVKRTELKATLARISRCCASRKSPARRHERAHRRHRRTAAWTASAADRSQPGSAARSAGEAGSPERRLPPVVHVAGTNGKGSTCAFLRAMAEAAGQRVHVYTSPHLVRFNERIRFAGKLVSDDALAAALEHVERVNAGAAITVFEVITAVAFHLFARDAGRSVCAGGRSRRPWRRDQCDRPAGRLRDHLDLARSSRIARRHAAADRGGEGRHHEAGVPVAIGAQPDEVTDVLLTAAATRRCAGDAARSRLACRRGSLQRCAWHSGSAPTIAAWRVSARQCRHRHRRDARVRTADGCGRHRHRGVAGAAAAPARQARGTAAGGLGAVAGRRP